MLFKKLTVIFGREGFFLKTFITNKKENIFFFINYNNNIFGGFIQLSHGVPWSMSYE